MEGILLFSNVYTENAFLLSQRLKIPITLEIKANGTYIIFGAALQAKRLLEFSIRNPVKFMILNGENITSKYYDKNDIEGKYYIQLQKHFPTYQYSQYTADYIEKLFGIKCAGLYDFEFLNRDNKYSNNGIDLLFYGFPNEERIRTELKLKKKYPTKNIIFAYTVYGNDLVELIEKSKCVLNIPYFKDSALEIHRINQALASGCKVFSKRSVCDYLNKKYESKITFVEDYLDIEL